MTSSVVTFGALLLVLLLALVLLFFLVLSMFRLRRDQSLWREVKLELERQTQWSIDSLVARIDSLEHRVDRILPVAKITVVGGREDRDP